MTRSRQWGARSGNLERSARGIPYSVQSLTQLPIQQGDHQPEAEQARRTVTIVNSHKHEVSPQARGAVTAHG